MQREAPLISVKVLCAVSKAAKLLSSFTHIAKCETSNAGSNINFTLKRMFSPGKG